MLSLKKLFILSFIGLIIFSHCKKKSNNSPENNNPTSTTGGNTPPNFTPPVTNYFFISDSANTSDMSIANCDMNGGSFGISKPFNSLNINPGQLRIYFDSLGSSSHRDIRNRIEEGGYRVFNIDTVYTTLTDRVNVEVDAGEQSGYYYYKAYGKLYVSKKNNKLRFTSDGTLQMLGKKYLGPGFSGMIYSRTVKFSIEEGAQL